MQEKPVQWWEMRLIMVRPFYAAMKRVCKILLVEFMSCIKDNSSITSLKIYDNVKHNKPKAMENFLGLLKSGGSDYPVNQAAKAGADLTNKETFMAVITRFESLIDQLEKVLEEK